MNRAASLILLIGLNAATSAKADDIEYVDPHYAATVKTELDGNRVRVQYPSLKVLPREAVSDVVYFGKNYSGKKICKHLSLGDYESGSKVIAKVRAVSTANLLMNRIQYRIDPIARLAVGYRYSKTQIVKELICSSE